MTRTLISAPQVGTVTFVLTRIRLADFFTRTSRDRPDLLDALIGLVLVVFALLEIGLGDFHAIDGDVANAAGEGWRFIGEDFLPADDAAEEGVAEHGVVLARRVDRLRRLKLIVDAQRQVRRVHGHVDFLPFGVVQVFAD